MLTSHDFDGPEIDDFHHCDVYTAKLPGATLDGVGELVEPYDELWIHWLPTTDYPEPIETRLRELIPSLQVIADGIRHAMDEYKTEWNVEWLRDSIRDSLSESEWKQFLENGYLPFMVVDRIYLNPAAGVISCRCDCSIDPNIEEHGLIVLKENGEWIARWSTEDSKYFSDWNEERVE
ncbi:hypothetical protein SH501x_001920 [Pirellulaceae bacterium SH501]